MNQLGSAPRASRLATAPWAARKRFSEASRLSRSSWSPPGAGPLLDRDRLRHRPGAVLRQGESVSRYCHVPLELAASRARVLEGHVVEALGEALLRQERPGEVV